MRAYQDDSRKRVVDSLYRALDELEAEVQATAGAVSAARLTRKALCVRAKVGESTLKNPSHDETRKYIESRLKRLRAPCSAVVAPSRSEIAASPKGPSKDLPAGKAVKAMAAQLDLAMRRVSELKAEIRRKDLRIKDLELQIRQHGAPRAA